MNFKKIFLTILKTLGIIVGAVAIYVILGLGLPYISIGAKNDGQKKNIPIYIYTNGVHTDIVVPIKNNLQDWSSKILFDNTISKKQDFNYVGIGWGDKGFYLDTPTWADLKFSTAVKAAFWMSESAMHCTFYKTMTEGDDCVKIIVSEKQYQDLVKFIDAKFDKDDKGNYILIPTKAVYGKNDAFYDAKGSYSFMNTCNTWANDALKSAGQKAALWTPTDKGIFQQYK